MIALGFLVSLILLVLQIAGVATFSVLVILAPFLIGIGLQLIAFFVVLAIMAVMGK